MPYSNFAGLTPVTPPTATPVSVADVQAHSRIFIDADDSLIGGYISAATSACEDHCRRAFMPQTWRLALEQWPGRSPMVGYREANSQEYWKWNHISLPKPPLASITSFTYTDSAGNVLSMTQSGFGNQVGNYLLDLEAEPGRIVLPFSGIWPTTVLSPASPILITYACGYPAYSGVFNVGPTGLATWVSGDKFSPFLAGTWITIQGATDPGPESLGVLKWTDDTHIQLLLSQPTINLPSTAATWTGNAVPQPLRAAVLMLVAHLYENREPILTGRGEVAIEIPKTLDALLAQYIIYRT